MIQGKDQILQRAGDAPVVKPRSGSVAPNTLLLQQISGLRTGAQQHDRGVASAVVAQHSAGVYGAWMSDYAAESSPTELRFKADACRALAETSDNSESKAIWLARAKHWEELALRAVQRLLESVRSAHKA